MSNTGYGHTPEPLMVVISGPSGVGKDSVVNRMKERDLPFHFVVTATSRPVRPNEVQGVDYYFVTEEEFKRMIEAGELIEHALVYGEYKGIPKKHIREALDSGINVVLRVDVQGAAAIRELEPNAVLIFLTTTDEEELIERLKARKTETPKKLKIRIETAKEEMCCIEDFDYKVVNADDELDACVDTILAIIKAENHRVHPHKVNL